MLRRMQRAASLLLLASAISCSVYSSDLIDGGSAGGSPGGAGGNGASGGKSNGSAGKLDVAGETGDGGGPIDEPGGGTGAGATSGASATGGTSTGGTGGGPVSGGSSGSGTAGEGPAGGGGLNPNLIDGFEDDDLTLAQTGGGVWYLYDDGTVGTAGPTPLACSPLTDAPEALGGYAMHVTSTGFTGWGSGLGVDFRAGKKPYDGSKFTGVRFWARVGGTNKMHRFQIADATTDKAGLKCDASATAPEGKKCEDHFGISKTFTSTWAQYTIRFDELSQVGWGLQAAALDTTALYGLQITAKAKTEVDLWLDQVEFF
jgi:hypothetical protein